MTSPLNNYKMRGRDSVEAARVKAAERLRQHEVNLDGSWDVPDPPRPLRASMPLPQLGNTTIFNALQQSCIFSPSWMWRSQTSAIQSTQDNLFKDSDDSNSTVFLASLDVSWVSGSLSLNTDPKQSADNQDVLALFPHQHDEVSSHN